MKRLDRYMWRELFVPFLIGTLAVVLMFQANYLIYIYKSFSVASVPPIAILKLLLFETPGWLNLTLPVGTSLGASLAISRLTRESELTAMRSSGASILRVLRPVMVFGLAVALANFIIAERVMPPSKKASRDLFAQVALLVTAPEFKSNVTLNLSNKVAIIGTVSRGSNNQIQLASILLYERPQQDQVVITTAETGVYQDGIWRIEKPRVWMIQDKNLIAVQSFKEGEDLVINEPVSIEQMFSPPEPDELSIEELSKAIREQRKQGYDTRPQEILLHTRFSVPAACLIFALVAPVFAVYFARTGAFFGVLLSFIVVILYYNFFIICTQILGPNGFAPPVVAAWLPNIVFAVVGLFALRRLE